MEEKILTYLTQLDIVYSLFFFCEKLIESNFDYSIQSYWVLLIHKILLLDITFLSM